MSRPNGFKKFMKTIISKFSKDALSKDNMKEVKGGWYYTFSCSCGDSGFTGSGDLNDYRYMARYYCSGRGGVSCNFN
jgi:natural product precursor